jgi:hypothetical protein
LGVLVRWLIALLAVPALLSTGCGGGSSSGDEAAGSIAGDWIGTLKQRGLAPFRIAVRIEASAAGRVAYTGIECGGRWNLDEILESKPPVYEFTEQINEGAGGECKGTGLVSVEHRTIGDPGLHYEFRGGGVVSRGLLHRTDSAGLKPTFDEAGVNPP